MGKNAPERIRKIYVLKNLKNRFMWAGEKVHDCIKHTLKNLQRNVSILPMEDIVSITLNQMRDEFRSSRDKRYLAYPKSCALFEHEYDLDLPDDKWKKIADDVEKCLRNLSIDLLCWNQKITITFDLFLVVLIVWQVRRSNIDNSSQDKINIQIKVK